MGIKKIILAREISRHPDLLVIVRPTRGLDIGAINYIHNQIIKLRDHGVVILLVSFELEELLTLSDNTPTEIFYMLPYLITLIALIFTGCKSKTTKALRSHYDSSD